VKCEHLNMLVLMFGFMEVVLVLKVDARVLCELMLASDMSICDMM
jgi:hypothetical protein